MADRKEEVPKPAVGSSDTRETHWSVRHRAACRLLPNGWRKRRWR